MNCELTIREMPMAGLGLLIVLLPAWSADSDAAEYAIGSCDGEYEQCLSHWKQERVGFLKGDDGYLNLAGLYWLAAGDNSFGSDRSNDLVFSQNAAPHIGTFILEDGIVRMSVNPDVDVRLDGRRVGRMAMRDDTTSNPATVSHGSLSWTVIKRDDRFAVRLRDFAHPSLSAFAPIQYFPASREYRVDAVLVRYPVPRVVRVNTVIPGLDYKPQSPGVVKFALGGEAFELEAYEAGNELFIVFGDQTSGRETYPAGRFLYAKMPQPEGQLTLDFNTAHNPPCAFNEFATCPVASPGNRLKTRILAGEKYDPAVHH